jgi:RNase P subunit RPR2
MSATLECKKCGKHMATLRDARVRVGMIVYCAPCDTLIQHSITKKRQAESDVPDFLSGLFGGKSRQR